MSQPGPRHLAVARLRKPHGLKGDVVLFPLTDDPATVLGQGRQVWVMDLAGDIVGGPLEIERSRAYHREWLVKFAGIEGRDALEPLRGRFLAAPASELPEPSGDEVYLHELEGFAVRLEDGTPVGLVSSVYQLPAGLMIEVQGPKREFLLPYRREFVREVDRPGRRLTVAPPAGLLEP
ncbi:MAG TPA: ribosome maturation factor RimM [Gemmatimonadales bacterium]|jgi:16S rRNA processing protein RimM|nr:ribosome maturation factor RimM [Gemmatimonadales bacterium]